MTIGFGAAVLIGRAAQTGRDIIMGIDKGGNMAAPLLAEALGGSVFLGFLAAVAFATILAVVAGLTLAGASALSHDLYVGVIRSGVANEKEEVKVAKDRDGRPRHRGHDPGHAVQGTERGLHGRPGLCHRGQRELPGPAAVAHVEEVHHQRARCAASTPAWPWRSS